MLKTVLLFLLSSAAIIVSAAENANPAPVVSASTDSPPDAIVVEKNEPSKLPEISGEATTPVSAPTSVTTVSTIPTETTVTTESTTTPSSTTAVPPTPVPPPESGKWIVEGNNRTCIVAQMAVQFNVTYVTTKNELAYKVMDLPVNGTVAEGTCGSSNDTKQSIVLIWESTIPSNVTNNMTFHFEKNATENRYSLSLLEVVFAPAEFPQLLSNYSTRFVHRKDEFSVEVSNSYRCLKLQTFNLTRADDKTAGEIRISNMQLQAFHTENTNVFGFAEDCAFDTPDIVPIAVGCALAILVVIVLIAYLVGRRRSQARGYLSM